MSRIGKQPIEIPSGVTITVDEHAITVTGPKGTLSQFMMPGISVTVDGNIATVSRIDDEQVHRSKHGLVRSLVNNMIIGVTTGYSKSLEINGVGYKVQLAGSGLKLSLGFSHDVNYAFPEGITAKVEQNNITIIGNSKQLVGQVAADIRSLKKPEPYKGKGIKYTDERVLRKSGKSGKE